MEQTMSTEKGLKQPLYDMLYLTVCGIHEQAPSVQRLCGMDFLSVYEWSKRHSLTAITDMALEKAVDELPQELQETYTALFKRWKENKDQAVLKNVLMEIEAKELYRFLDESKIWYAPLKGALIKDLYPKSGMRQMSDYDILFDDTYEEKLHEWFLSRGYDAVEYQTGKDNIYRKKPVFHFEMHKKLFYQKESPEQAEYFKDFGEKRLQEKSDSFFCSFSNEAHYIYNVSHAYKHFVEGGTGLRSLLDIYVLQTKWGDTLDWEYIGDQFQKMNLNAFDSAVRSLSNKIFSDASVDVRENLTDEERELLEYFLTSGTYGTSKRRIENTIKKLNFADRSTTSFWAKLRYFWHRLFADRDVLQTWIRNHAPALSPKWLWPVAYVVRMVTGIVGIRKYKKEINTVRKA